MKEPTHLVLFSHFQQYAAYCKRIIKKKNQIRQSSGFLLFPGWRTQINIRFLFPPILLFKIKISYKHTVLFFPVNKPDRSILHAASESVCFAVLPHKASLWSHLQVREPGRAAPLPLLLRRILFGRVSDPPSMLGFDIGPVRITFSHHRRPVWVCSTLLSTDAVFIPLPDPQLIQGSLNPLPPPKKVHK